MNKKIDIEYLERRIPFTVPSGYFQELKYEIQEQCKLEDKPSFISIMKLQIITPVLGIMFVLFTLFTNQKVINNKIISEVELTKNDLISYLENNLSEELLFEYTILEDEKEVDELSYEIDYLLEYDMEYNLIINQL
jgi:hypothetical protein